MSTAVLNCPAQRFLPWAGANVKNAPRVGELLSGCKYVGIWFVGGFSEVPHIDARIIVVNDLHRDAINLGKMVATRRRDILAVLRWLPVSDYSREQAVAYMRECATRDDSQADIHRAIAYFVTQWMGRSGQSGTDKELSGGVPIRTNANGGGTAQRHWSAVRSLAQWGEVMRRCDFESMDWTEFTKTYCKDEEGHGYYADPPGWPGAKVEYTHTFVEKDHRAFAARVSQYRKARVVVRYGDHPLIRELYPEPEWMWHLMDGRNQGNNAVREALIVRN